MLGAVRTTHLEAWVMWGIAMALLTTVAGDAWQCCRWWQQQWEWQWRWRKATISQEREGRRKTAGAERSGIGCGEAGTAEPHNNQPWERGDKVEAAVLGAGFEDNDGRNNNNTGQMTTERALWWGWCWRGDKGGGLHRRFKWSVPALSIHLGAHPGIIKQQSDRENRQGMGGRDGWNGRGGILCRSPDSWVWTDQPRIQLMYLPTPPKCRMRAL